MKMDIYCIHFEIDLAMHSLLPIPGSYDEREVWLGWENRGTAFGILGGKLSWKQLERRF
jgi:hypothetical protein